MSQVNWTTVSVIIGTVVPLVGIPLMMITMYLRSIRDYQVRRYDELVDRVGGLDDVVSRTARLVREFERDYTTKEEWLRESLLARKQLEKLNEGVARIQSDLENGNGLAQHFARATQAMVRLTEALVKKE